MANPFSSNTSLALTTSIVIVLGIVVGYGEYRRSTLSQEVLGMRTSVETIKKENRELESRLSQLTTESKSLIELLQSEKQQSKEFQDQLSKIAGTMGMLNKLSKTDKELLQKYSKVYFLNEHYIPSSLTLITPDYTQPRDKLIQIHTSVWPFLERMLKNAEADGINLRVVSGYRSFTEQASLKSSYKVTYGSGANRFSADQGYSEHQLGTTIDITTPENSSLTVSFENTKAFAWLKENAHKYGFALSYPKNNAFYQYEPWHWRFVGTDLAAKLHDDGKYFYDLDQREIDSFLSVIFD